MPDIRTALGAGRVRRMTQDDPLARTDSGEQQS